MASLWKSPQRGVVFVALDRYEERHGDQDRSFAEFVRQRVPTATLIPVRWRSYAAFVRVPLIVDPDEVDRENAWIDELARAIGRGDDVPPLVIDSRRKGRYGVIVDGRHRSRAAARLRLRVAPIVDLAEMAR